MTFEFSLSGLSGQVAGANLMIAPQNVRVDVYGYSSAASVVNNPPAGTLLGSFNIGDTILAILDFINDLIPPPVPAPPDPIEIELIGLSLQSVGPWTPASSSPSVEIDLTSGPSDTIIVRVPGIPVPAALPLLASGLGVLGLLGWRRKRSGAA